LVELHIAKAQKDVQERFQPFGRKIFCENIYSFVVFGITDLKLFLNLVACFGAKNVIIIL